jgi:hypothetical protein
MLDQEADDPSAELLTFLRRAEDRDRIGMQDSAVPSAAARSGGHCGLKCNFGDLVAAVTIMRRERIAKRPALAEGESEPDHVAPSLGFRPVLEAGAPDLAKRQVMRIHAPHRGGIVGTVPNLSRARRNSAADATQCRSKGSGAVAAAPPCH